MGQSVKYGLIFLLVGVVGIGAVVFVRNYVPMVVMSEREFSRVPDELIREVVAANSENFAWALNDQDWTCSESVYERAAFLRVVPAQMRDRFSNAIAAMNQATPGEVRAIDEERVWAISKRLNRYAKMRRPELFSKRNKRDQVSERSCEIMAIHLDGMDILSPADRAIIERAYVAKFGPLFSVKVW